LTRLRLRDSAALPIGRLPAPSFDFLARAAPFANLWELTLRFFKFPRGFQWRPEMLPALRVLDIVGIVTPASFVDDTGRYAQLFRAVAPQLHSLSVKVENVAQQHRPIPGATVVGATVVGATVVGATVAAPAMRVFVNVGGVLEALAVDAPLRALEMEGRSIRALGPAAHGTLERITLRDVPPLSIPALASFRCLRTASLSVCRAVGTAADVDVVEDLGLAHLPDTLEDLRLNFNFSCVGGGRHEVAARWPDTPLRHLVALQTLCVNVTFPPRGFGSLVRHLLGARPRTRATIRAASALTAELESRLMFAIEEDMYDDEEDLRAVIDDLETIPDVTPADVAACPCRDLVMAGIAVF
jgi:hypothetical protein